MIRPERIVLLGAAGYTGRLVGSALRSAGLPFVSAARDLSRIPEAEARLRVNVENPDDVGRVAQAGTLLINCVGPFLLRSRHVARAAAAAGAVYLDVCGEEPFVAFSQSELEQSARRSGALLVHACAMESFPADMLVAQMCDRRQAYEDLSAYYQLPAAGASPGTVLTMRLIAGWRTATYRDGAFHEAPPGSFTRDAEDAGIASDLTAVFAPYPEVRFWPVRYATRSASSFLLMHPAEARVLRATAAHRRVRSVENVVARHLTRKRPGPSPEERRNHHFSVAVTATARDGGRSLARLTGRDPYGLTAAIIAWAAGQLMNGNADTAASGVRAPSEVFDATGLHAEYGEQFQLTVVREPPSPSPGQ
jgi:short subunit dehydrogenase-like uncharacterized protein